MEQIGTPNQKVLDKAQKRRAATPEHKRVPAQEMVRHAHALSCQFIRLVRHCLRYKTPWAQALPLFKARLHCYL